MKNLIRRDSSVLVVFIRTIILYFVVIIGIRVMGKRQLGELQPSELVTTILISNIATLPIEDMDVPLIGGVIPIVTLVFFEILMSVISLKSIKARRLLSGNPRIVVREGAIDQNEMKKLRLSIDDLMEELRQNNIFDIKDVDLAIVETNGKLSINKKFSAQEATNETMKIKPPQKEQGIPVLIINDSNVITQAMSYCQISEDWLEKIIKQEGYKLQEIFLMTCTPNKDYYIVPKQAKGS
ncbi:MAG: DUF421 domain-containing protein [Oscillospiraceae bacterium]